MVAVRLRCLGSLTDRKMPLSQEKMVFIHLLWNYLSIKRSEVLIDATGRWLINQDEKQVTKNIYCM